MSYHLAPAYILKRLETPSLYNIASDELYELDEEAFAFLAKCSTPEGASGSGHEEFLNQCLEEGILTREPVASLPQKPGRSPLPSLRYLELQITRRCNLRCGHCFLEAGCADELPLLDILGVLKELEAMQGLRVLITGGEPTLHSDFDALNEALPDYALRRVLFTNGTTLTAEAMKGLNFHEIQVSIDGLEDAHDSLRGRGTYARAMTTVRAALDLGLQVSISTMVHKANLADFEEMQEMFTDLGLRDWTVDVPSLADPAHRLSPEVAGEYLKYGFGEGLHGGPAEGEACGYHLLSVMADGQCAKCTFYSDSTLGSIKEGLMTCWQRLSRPALKDTRCAGCDALPECRGGCRFRAEILEGRGGRDLYKCRLYGKIK